MQFRLTKAMDGVDGAKPAGCVVEGVQALRLWDLGLADPIDDESQAACRNRRRGGPLPLPAPPTAAPDPLAEIVGQLRRDNDELRAKVQSLEATIKEVL